MNRRAFFGAIAGAPFAAVAAAQAKPVEPATGGTVTIKTSVIRADRNFEYVMSREQVQRIAEATYRRTIRETPRRCL